MADPVSILILVAAADLGTPTTIEMARAARESLGERVVSVREAAPDFNDAAALDAERDAHAGVVAELQWADPSHRRASLRVHLASTGLWVERSIGFMPSDPATERGRALGFAVVAILPENSVASSNAPAPLASASTSPPPSAPPASAPPAPPGAQPPARAPETAAASPSSTSSALGEAETPLAEVNAQGRVRPPSMAFDVLGVGATGGAAAGFGASAAVQWFALHGLALRLGVLVRMGEIDAAAAHTSWLAVTAGVVFHPWRATASRPFGASLRADYVLQRESVTHFDPDDPDPAVQSRWLSGFDAVIGGSWLFAPYVEFVAGVGLEDVLATTEVDVRGRSVASLPPLRPIGETGLRLRF